LKKLLGSTWIFLLLITAGPAAAEVLDWTVHTDQSRLLDIDVVGSEIWAAGSGGVVQLDLLTAEVKYFNSADDEFHTNRFRTILKATTGDLWAGSEGEGLLRYRSDEFPAWRRFQAYQGLASDTILCLLEGEDGLIWYGSDNGFGLMEGDEPTKVWDEYNGLSHEAVHSLAFEADTLLVGTDLGLYRLIPLGDGETVLEYDELSPANLLDEIVVLADSIWVLSIDDGDDRYLHRRATGGSAWVQLTLPMSGYQVAAMAVSGDSLIFSLDESGRDDRIYSYKPVSGLWTDLSGNLQELNDRYPGYSVLIYDTIAVADDGAIWLGGDVQNGFGPGLIHNTPGTWTRVPLNSGPMGSEMKVLSLGTTGRLWAMCPAAGASFEAGEWTHYPSDPAFAGLPRFGLDVLEDSQGWVWMTRYAGALGRFNLETGDQELIEASGMQILCMDEDDLGNRYFGSDGQGLDICTAADTWYEELFMDEKINGLAIVSESRVALLILGRGLVVWDHGGNPVDGLGDIEYTTSDGGGIDDPEDYLKEDTFFSSLAVAPDGGLWVGQDNGLVHVSPAPDGGVNEYVVTDFIGQAANGVPGLLSVNVADIDVAPDGSVWVGSKSGLSHVFPGDGDSYQVSNWTTEVGREILGEPFWLTVESVSPLPDAEVRQVTVSVDGSTIYAGTNNGLATIVLNPDPILPEDMDLWLYPNPVNSALGHDEVFLGGTVTDVSVRIYNLEGQLVREMEELVQPAANFDDPGAVVWDLKTRLGNKASSGIYMVRLESRGVVSLKKIVLIQ
jgi:hypothetical protein